jgi:3,4-dihydroxy 2-butanone 4-phosphate synthase
VFPLCAKRGGVLERGGHTEATVDLNRLAGLEPCGVLCELTNPDGTMAKLHEIVAFAIKHQMAMCTVQDIIAYREHIGDVDAEMVVPENSSAVTKPTRTFPRSTFASGR